MSIDLHFWRSREREREKLRYSVRDPSIKHQGLRIKDDTFGLPSVSSHSVSSRQNHGFIEIYCLNLKTDLIMTKFIINLCLFRQLYPLQLEHLWTIFLPLR